MPDSEKKSDENWLVRQLNQATPQIVAWVFVAAAGGGFGLLALVDNVDDRTRDHPDRIAAIEKQHRQFQREIDSLKHRIKSLEDFRDEGGRFTNERGDTHWREIQRNSKAIEGLAVEVQHHDEYARDKVERYESRFAWLEAMLRGNHRNGGSNGGFE